MKARNGISWENGIIKSNREYGRLWITDMDRQNSRCYNVEYIVMVVKFVIYQAEI